MDIRCPHCKAYLNIREVVTRCTECKKLIKPKTNNMKATLDNFLVKWDGNNPIWKELIEWLNKDTNNNLFSGDMEDRYYGRIEGKRRCPMVYQLNDVINIPIITLEQWKELLTKTETINNFKEGDKVFVAPYGWCEYCHTSVNVGKEIIKQGCNHYEVDTTLVSFTEYKLEGFTQERPFTPEVGKNYFFWNKGTLETAVVGWGMYVGKSNDELKPYIFGSLAFSFCSDKNPLL
jgi:hypothetical protein